MSKINVMFQSSFMDMGFSQAASFRFTNIDAYNTLKKKAMMRDKAPDFCMTNGGNIIVSCLGYDEETKQYKFGSAIFPEICCMIRADEIDHYLLRDVKERCCVGLL